MKVVLAPKSSAEPPTLCPMCLSVIESRNEFESRPGSGWCDTCRFWVLGPGVPLSAFGFEHSMWKLAWMLADFIEDFERRQSARPGGIV